MRGAQVSPRWLYVVLAAGFAAMILTLSLGGCSIYTPAGERPLTLREQVYQTGGVLVGIGQELDFAIQNGSLKKENAKPIVKAYEAAYQVYRQASAFALAENDPEAGRARLELLRLIDLLRRDLTAALVKP